MKKRFWYLASPYTRYRAGHDAAFRQACSAKAVMMRAGIAAFSPIVHSHPVTMHADMDPIDAQLWLLDDEPFMEAACGLLIWCIDGWDESAGVRFERDFFRKAFKPEVLLDPSAPDFAAIVRATPSR